MPVALSQSGWPAWAAQLADNTEVPSCRVPVVGTFNVMSESQPSSDAGDWPPGPGGLLTHPVHVSLLPDPAAPGMARRLVATSLSNSALHHLTNSAQLVVSELVTNAARLTRHRLDLDVWLGAGFLQIGVGDDVPGKPTRQAAAASEEGGRGLAVVDALVSTRDIIWDHDGKVVWCRLETG